MYQIDLEVTEESFNQFMSDYKIKETQFSGWLTNREKKFNIETLKKVGKILTQENVFPYWALPREES